MAEELKSLHTKVDRDNVILDKRPKSTLFKLADNIVKFQVHPMNPNKTTSIGANLEPDIAEALRNFLRENWDIFAWDPSDMPGIPHRLAENNFNILKGISRSSKHFSASLNPSIKEWVRNWPSSSRPN